MTIFATVQENSDVLMWVQENEVGKNPSCSLTYGGVPYQCDSRWELWDYAKRLESLGVRIPFRCIARLETHALHFEGVR